MDMSRHAPELALVVGALLALGFAVYGLLFSEAVLATLLVALALLYPFAAFAILRDDDPTTVIYPRLTLAVAGAFGSLTFAYGVAVARPTFGLLVGLVAVVPVVLYHGRYGRAASPLPPWATLTLAAIAAVLVLGYGVVVAGGDLLASVDAALLLLVALDDCEVRGSAFGPYSEMLAVGLCTGGGALLVLYFVVVDEPTTGLVLAAPLLAVGAFLALE